MTRWNLTLHEKKKLTKYEKWEGKKQNFNYNFFELFRTLTYVIMDNFYPCLIWFEVNNVPVSLMVYINFRNRMEIDTALHFRLKRKMFIIENNLVRQNQLLCTCLRLKISEIAGWNIIISNVKNLYYLQNDFKCF
jgi:hypothetical protein